MSFNLKPIEWTVPHAHYPDNYEGVIGDDFFELTFYASVNTSSGNTSLSWVTSVNVGYETDNDHLGYYPSFEEAKEGAKEHVQKLFASLLAE